MIAFKKLNNWDLFTYGSHIEVVYFCLMLVHEACTFHQDLKRK